MFELVDTQAQRRGWALTACSLHREQRRRDSVLGFDRTDGEQLALENLK